MSKHPWTNTLHAINQRCYNKKSYGYKWYGEKGIINLLTEDDLKYLWMRDKAYLLEIPSIDRIESDKDYTLNNCRYIERKLNSLNASIRSHNKSHCVNGHEYTFENTYLNKKGWRNCKKCRVISTRKYKLKLRIR